MQPEPETPRRSQPPRDTALPRDPKIQSDLERLLDRISAGSIEDVDELQPQDLELLRSYYGDGEDLQDVLDRLRNEGDEGV